MRFLTSFATFAALSSTAFAGVDDSPASLQSEGYQTYEAQQAMPQAQDEKEPELMLPPKAESQPKANSASDAMAEIYGRDNVANHEKMSHSSMGSHSYMPPLMITGGHTHSGNEWMLTYRYMRMEMHGNRSGTERVTSNEIFNQGFTVAPETMVTQMHMLSGMYGINDDVTIMGMLPYVFKDMDSIRSNGQTFSTESDGLGDIEVAGLWKAFERESDAITLELGVSLPTGDTDKRDDTPIANNMKLPYPMQIGSGTYDFKPAINWVAQHNEYTVGAKTAAILRTGENDDDYRLGNVYSLQGWVKRPMNEAVTISTMLEAKRWQNIHGQDTAINASTSPNNDPDRQAGSRLDFGVGVDWTPDFLNGAEAGMSVNVPLWQNLKGPQMEKHWGMMLTVRKTF